MTINSTLIEHVDINKPLAEQVDTIITQGVYEYPENYDLSGPSELGIWTLGILIEREFDALINMHFAKNTYSGSPEDEDMIVNEAEILQYRATSAAEHLASEVYFRNNRHILQDYNLFEGLYLGHVSLRHVVKMIHNSRHCVVSGEPQKESDVVLGTMTAIEHAQATLLDRLSTLIRSLQTKISPDVHSEINNLFLYVKQYMWSEIQYRLASNIIDANGTNLALCSNGHVVLREQGDSPSVTIRVIMMGF